MVARASRSGRYRRLVAARQPWISSGRKADRCCRKADTQQQVLEARVVPQAVHAGVYVKIGKPVGAFFQGLLLTVDRAVVFLQTDVDSGHEVGCDIPLPGQIFQIVQHARCLLFSAGRTERLRQSRTHQGTPA